MNGEEKILKTEFWEIGLEDLGKIREELEWQKKVAERLLRKLDYIEANWENEIEYDIECFLTDICEFFNNCNMCPIRNNCRYAKDSCDEVYNCESCPRLRLCVRDRSPGLKEYLDEGDEQ
jgi:hypothetical protein